MKTNKKSCFLNEGIPQKCIWGTGPRKWQNLKQQQSSILNRTNLENITSMPEGHLPNVIAGKIWSDLGTMMMTMAMFSWMIVMTMFS